MFNFSEYETGITLVMDPSRFLHLSRRHIWQGWWFETTVGLNWWHGLPKKSSDSLHWTYGCDLDFVCLKLVDSNWAIWSSKKDVTKDRGSISITKDTKRHVKKREIAFRGRGLEKCGSSLKAAEQEVWRDGSAPPVVFSSSHSSLMCILAFQNFLTPLGPGQPYGQANLGLEYTFGQYSFAFFTYTHWTNCFANSHIISIRLENCARSTSVCKSLDSFISFFQVFVAR